jgi:Tfp pilus assembly protein PilX
VSPRRRLAAQDGVALVVALVTMVIALLLIVATVAFALAGLRVSSENANGEAALHAADSGLDIALWRTNKILLSGIVGQSGLTGITAGIAATLGCTGVSVGGAPGAGESTVNSLLKIGAGNLWCAATPESNGDGSSYEYWESTNVGTLTAGSVPSAPVGFAGSAATLNRLVVATGTSGGITRRVMAIFTGALDVNGNPTGLWQESGYVVCPNAQPSAGSQNPDAGCPSPYAPSGAPG